MLWAGVCVAAPGAWPLPCPGSCPSDLMDWCRRESIIGQSRPMEPAGWRRHLCRVSAPRPDAIQPRSRLISRHNKRGALTLPRCVQAAALCGGCPGPAGRPSHLVFKLDLHVFVGINQANDAKFLHQQPSGQNKTRVRL